MSDHLSEKVGEVENVTVEAYAYRGGAKYRGVNLSVYCEEAGLATTWPPPEGHDWCAEPPS